jgi:hypothetical protein
MILAGALGVAAAAFAWSFGAAQTHAQTPSSDLSFTIEAEGESGCDTSGGDAVCFIDPGTEFALNVTLDELPEGVDMYEACEVVISYTGLESADDGSAEAWPDCGFPATFFEPGRLAMSCSIGIPPAGPSTYTGLIASNTFTCTESGAITLQNVGMGNTSLTQTVGSQFAEPADETLTITCGDEPTATSTPGPDTGTPALPTGLPPTGTGMPNDGASSTALWFAVAALLTLAAIGLGTLGWKAARSAR